MDVKVKIEDLMKVIPFSVNLGHRKYFLNDLGKIMNKVLMRIKEKALNYVLKERQRGKNEILITYS